MTTPAGWYPDPSGAPRLQYWDGHEWWQSGHSSPRKPNRDLPERIAITVFAVVFGGLATIFAIAGDNDAAGGVAIMAVLVGTPMFLILLAVRRVRQSRQDRIDRRRYEEGLAFRLDQQHQAIMRGDVEAGVFGAFRPPRLARNDHPDAEQMRQQAWQPELSGPAQAVRPKNPAPWHVVTQYPTRQFKKQAEQQAASDHRGRAGAPR